MTIVQIDMIKGCSVEQKRELVKKVTDAICQTAHCAADAVKIVIREVAE